PALVRAEEPSLLVQADAAYAKREDVPEAKIAMTLYERAAVSGSTVAVECFWKASRAAWWVGGHDESRDDRLASYQKGIDFAKRALDLDPNSDEAHFWLGGNMGSYGDAKGVMKSLSLIKPIRHEMEEVIRLNDHCEDGGAYHVLGVVDY